MSKTICFIPVRKGSKGIPGKNLKELGGKPLVCWIIDSVLSSYYNTFQLLLEVLKPEAVIVLEGCHHQEQILSDVARKNGIPSIAIQQGWPSFIHSMFRNMPYSHYLTWGAGFDRNGQSGTPVCNLYLSVILIP